MNKTNVEIGVSNNPSVINVGFGNKNNSEVDLKIDTGGELNDLDLFFYEILDQLKLWLKFLDDAVSLDFIVDGLISTRLIEFLHTITISDVASCYKGIMANAEVKTSVSAALNNLDKLMYTRLDSSATVSSILAESIISFCTAVASEMRMSDNGKATLNKFAGFISSIGVSDNLDSIKYMYTNLSEANKIEVALNNVIRYVYEHKDFTNALLTSLTSKMEKYSNLSETVKVGDAISAKLIILTPLSSITSQPLSVYANKQMKEWFYTIISD